MGYWQIHRIRKRLPGIFLRFALDLPLPAANLKGELLGCGLRRIIPINGANVHDSS